MVGKTKWQLVLQHAALLLLTTTFLVLPFLLTLESSYTQETHILREELNACGCHMKEAGCNLSMKGSHRNIIIKADLNSRELKLEPVCRILFKNDKTARVEAKKSEWEKMEGQTRAIMVSTERGEHDGEIFKRCSYQVMVIDSGVRSPGWLQILGLSQMSWVLATELEI